MIDIAIINGSNKDFLSLPRDVKIGFEYLNGALTFDTAIPGAFHMGLKLPAAPNSKILKMAHHIEVLPGVRALRAEISHKGTVVINGHLLLDSAKVTAESKVIDCDIIAEGIGLDLENTSIRDLLNEEIYDLGATTQEIVSAAAAHNNQFYPDTKICFPQLKNESHFGGKNEGDDGFVRLNWWDQALAEFKGNELNPAWVEIPYNGEPKWLNTHAIAPSVYVMPIVRTLFENSGYSLSGAYFDDTDLQKEILLGLYSLDKKEDRRALTVRLGQDFVWPTFYVNDAPPGSGFTLGAPVPWDTTEVDNTDAGPALGEFETVYPVEEEGRYVVQCVIFADFPSAVQVRFAKVTSGGSGTFFLNQTVSGPGQHFFTVTESLSAAYVGGTVYVMLTDLSNTGFTLNANTQLDIYRVDESTRNVFRGGFNLSKCVPNIPAKEFLLQLKIRWGIHVVLNQVTKEATLGFIEDIPSRPAFDLSSRVRIVSKEYSKSYIDQKRFVFKLSDGGKSIDWSRYQGAVLTDSDLPAAPIISQKPIYWVVSKNRFFEYTLEDGEDLFSWKAMEGDSWTQEIGVGEDHNVAIDGQLIPLEDTGDALVPLIDEDGNSEEYTMGTDGFPVRYMFFLGMTDGETGPYPAASQGVFDRSGNQIIARQQGLSDVVGSIKSPFVAWEKFLERTNGQPTVELELVHDMRVEEIPLDRPIRFKGVLMLVESIQEVLSNEDSRITLTARILK